MLETRPESLKQVAELISVCRDLRARGLIAAINGNVSVRVGDVMWITPTGCDLQTVKASDVVAIDMSAGCALGKGRPSKEWVLHWLAYCARPDICGVVHAHSPNSVAVGCLRGPGPCGSVVPAYTIGFALHAKRLPMIAYRGAATQDLAEEAAESLKTHDAVLLAHHGLVAVGKTVRQALYCLEEVEENCGIALRIGLDGRHALDPDRL